MVEANRLYLTAHQERSAALLRESGALLRRCDEANARLRSLLARSQ